MSDIRDMHPMSEFRVKAITIGLNLSWVVVVVLLIEGIRLNVISDPRAQASTIGVAGMLAALNLIKWESVGDRFIGGLLLWLWGAVMLVALGSALSVEELSQAMLGLYLALIVFVAVIGRTRTLMLVTFVTISSYLLIPVLQGHDRTVGSLIVPSIALGAMALATRITTIELANSLSTVVSQRDELARKEINFERLYEVSRTVSVGDSLDNVLPQLVGKIGTYLDCEVGLVMLPNQSGSSLEVVSPIWAAGHALEVPDIEYGCNPAIRSYRLSFVSHRPSSPTSARTETTRASWENLALMRRWW